MPYFHLYANIKIAEVRYSKSRKLLKYNCKLQLTSTITKLCARSFNSPSRCQSTDAHKSDIFYTFLFIRLSCIVPTEPELQLNDS